VRIGFGRLLPPACLHDVRAPAMFILGRIDAADQGDLVHLPGREGKQFANVRPGHGGGDVEKRPARVGSRLGIPRFKLAEPAGQKDDQHALLHALKLPRRRRLNHVREAESPQPCNRPRQELPPRQRVLR